LNISKGFPCPVCGNPVNKPSLVHAYVFPDDIEDSLDLIEGRFNSAVWPICEQSTAILTAEVKVLREVRKG
jgi:hypothetical protein